MSNRELLRQEVAKRADGMKIRLEHIHIEPGFNVPETPEEFEERVEALVLHLTAGGRIPPIEIRTRPEGGGYLVDGHARREAVARAVARGVPLQDPKDGHVWLTYDLFTGNDAERVARSVNSARGRTLTPLQLADRYGLLTKFGWSADKIATSVGKSGEHVRGILKLGSANSDVHQMVQSGKVSAKVALKVVRESGEKAGEVLKGHLETAKAEGKTKVTPKVANAADRVAKIRAEAAIKADAEMLRWLVSKGRVDRDAIAQEMTAAEVPAPAPAGGV